MYPVGHMPEFFIYLQAGEQIRGLVYVTTAYDLANMIYKAFSICSNIFHATNLAHIWGQRIQRSTWARAKADLVIPLARIHSQHIHSVRSPSAHQRNTIQMAFRWRADGGPLLDIYWVYIRIIPFSHLLSIPCTRQYLKSLQDGSRNC